MSITKEKHDTKFEKKYDDNRIRTGFMLKYVGRYLSKSM